jgi:hypothetical protein
VVYLAVEVGMIAVESGVTWIRRIGVSEPLRVVAH